MNKKSYENFFINFANKTKLDIILCLKEEEMRAGKIAECIGEEQSTVSHNLKKLLECNVLRVRTSGKERIYSLNKETVLPLLKLVEKHVKTCCDKTCEVCRC